MLLECGDKGPCLGAGLTVEGEVRVPISLLDSLKRSYSFIKEGLKEKTSQKSFSI